MNIIKLKLVLLLVLLLMPSTVVFAKEDDCTQICPPEAPLCFPNPLQYCTIQDLIERFLSIVFYFGILFTMVGALWGAFQIVIAGVNKPDKVKSGLNIIKWSLIGFTLLVFGRGLVYIVMSLLGVE